MKVWCQRRWTLVKFVSEAVGFGTTVLLYLSIAVRNIANACEYELSWLHAQKSISTAACHDSIPSQTLCHSKQGYKICQHCCPREHCLFTKKTHTVLENPRVCWKISMWICFCVVNVLVLEVRVAVDNKVSWLATCIIVVFDGMSELWQIFTVYICELSIVLLLIRLQENCCSNPSLRSAMQMPLAYLRRQNLR